MSDVREPDPRQPGSLPTDPTGSTQLTPTDPATTSWQAPVGWTADRREVEPRRGSRLRWAIVGVAGILVVALLGTAVWLAAQTPVGATSYLSDHTAFYTELRLDLPGGQTEKAADLLAHFPGFADRASLGAKLDDTLDRLFREATDQRYSYTSEIKPWFSGQVAVAITVPPTSASASEAEHQSVLAVVGVKDRAAAQRVVDRLLEDARSEGTTVSSAEHRGATIWTLDPGSSPSPAPSVLPSPLGKLPVPVPDTLTSPFGLALTDDAILVGADDAALREALDRRAGASPRLADAAAFREAMAGLRQDRVGAFWFSGEQLRAVVQETGRSSDSPAPSGMDQLLGQIPDHVAGTLHLESDRVVGELRTKLPAGAEQAVPRESTLTARVPSDTLVYLEVPSIGDGIGRIVEQVKAQPGFETEAGPMLGQVEALLGAPLEEYLDWAGDAAIAGWLEGDEPSVGLVASVLEPETAKARLAQLVAFIRLATLSGGSGIELTEEEYEGTTITTLTTDTTAAGLEGVGSVEVSWAVNDEVFVFSPQTSFVKVILDGPPDDSLAGSDRFADALAAAGGPATAGITYVDVAGIREAVATTLSAPDRDKFGRDVQPYLEPLDVFIAANVADGDEVVGRAILTVADRSAQ